MLKTIIENSDYFIYNRTETDLKMHQSLSTNCCTVGLTTIALGECINAFSSFRSLSAYNQKIIIDTGYFLFSNYCTFQLNKRNCCLKSLREINKISQQAEQMCCLPPRLHD